MRAIFIRLMLGAALALAAAPLRAQEPFPAPAANPAETRNGPALWRITDADSEIWLFGSVHALEPGVDWRRPELDHALQAADTVYFEAPTDFMAQAGVQLLVFRIGFNPPGARLSEQLTPEAGARLKRAAAEMGLPMDALESMRPWLAFMTLSAKLIESEGADPSEGVEMQLGAQARGAGKTIRAFETLEQQTRFFADMEASVQVALLEDTLRQLEEDAGQDQLSGLVQAWVAGDLPELQAKVFEGVEDLPPVFYQVVFLNRNAAWAEEIEHMLAGSGVTLIVVGAGHLLGPDSVLALLQARGISAERL